MSGGGLGVKGLPDAQARRQAVERIDLDVVVSAGAGSGKTALLVERYLYIVEHDARADVDNIAAITFTNRAAREMKTRLRDEFSKRFRTAQRNGEIEEARVWRERWRGLEQAPISTIHSLCSAILHQFPLAAAVDPQFQVMEERQAAVELPRVVSESLLGRLEEGRRSAAEVIGYYESLEQATEAIVGLLRLREKYRRWLENPLSAADIHHIWREGEAEWLREVFAAVFEEAEGQRIARTIGELAEIAPMHTGDSLASQLAVGARGLGGGVPTDISEAHELARALKTCWHGGRRAGRKDNWSDPELLEKAREAVCTLREWLEEAVELILKSEEEVSIATAELAAAILEEARAALAAWRRHLSLMPALDFDELQIQLRDLLRRDVDIRRRVRSRFRHILVDEFQDTNELQRELVWLLAGKELGDGEPANLFIVGDAKQSIYRFRDADVTVFTRCIRDFGKEDNAASLQLSTSFRPNEALMEFFNAVFAKPEMLGVEAKADYEAPYAAMDSVRAEVPIQPAVVGLLVASGDDDRLHRRLHEARAVAHFVKYLLDLGPAVYDHRTKRHRRLRPGDIAILFRAMTDAYLYEDQLTALDLPYYNAAGRGFFGRPEIVDLTNTLRAISNERDEIALVGVLRSPQFAVSDNTLFWLAQADGTWWERVQEAAEGGARQREPFSRIPAEEYPRLVRAAELLARWRREADRVPLSVLINDIIERTGYSAAMAAQLGGERAVANLGKFLDIAREYEAMAGGVAGFVEYVGDLAAVETTEAQAPTEEAEGESIRLSSVHAAKGLQWPVVVVADLCRSRREWGDVPRVHAHPNWGIIPAERRHYHPRRYRLIGEVARVAEGKEADAEDRRLLYVAMTRASDLLVMSSSVEAKNGTVYLAGVSWLKRLVAACGLPKQVELPSTTAQVEAELGAWFVVPAGCDAMPPLSVRVASEDGEEEVAGEGQREPAGEGAGAPDFQAVLASIPPDPAARQRFAVTELADYIHCPRYYQLKHIEALPDIEPARPAARRRLSALELGELAHRLLQMVGTGGVEELEGLLGEAVPGGGALLALTGEDQRRLQELLSGYLQSDFYREHVRACGRLRSEAWLSFQLDEALVEGKVDAVAETDAGLVLIDYKTGAGRVMEDEGSPDLDRFQIALYAHGLRELMDEWPALAVIAYLATGEIAQVALPAEADEAAGRAREAIGRIRAGQFAPRVGDWCATCRLRWACQASTDAAP